MAPSFKTQPKIFESLKTYLSSLSSKITDFNVGSVVNSFFFAISNTIGNLYATLQNVYNATFVATATGDDLDNRVADFGLVRRISTRSSGYVTFYKQTNSTADIIIPTGTRVKTITTNLLKGVEFQTTQEKILQGQITDETHTYYSGTDSYSLDSRRVYDLISVTGTLSGFAGYTFTKDVDYSLNNDDLSEAKLIWIGQKPDDSTVFYVSYSPLSIDVPIQSIGVGTSTNVASEVIINVSSKPAGIGGVINYEVTSGGTDQETDEELKERVPLYLSSLSKATKNALKAAALSIDGVKNASVVEYSPPNGLVTIFIDDGSGGAPTELLRTVKDKIEGTINGIENETETGISAAGIGVNVSAPVVKYITINVSIDISVGYDQTNVLNIIQQDVNQLLNSLVTGQTVIRAEIVKVIKEVEGVYNIDLSTLSLNGLLVGDISVDQNETAKLSTINIRVL